MSTDLRTLPAGASAWEVQLYEMLAGHVVSERALLETYIETAEASGSAALRYVVDLLIADERRHHRVWADLADSLCADAELVDEAPVVPHLDFDRSNADAVIEITERLLNSEREDLRQIKQVQKLLSSVSETTLWGLLVEMMEHDTYKHIALLRYANRQARAAKRRR